MAIVIDKLSPRAQLAGSFGKSFGGALEGLIGNKVKQLQTQSGLSELMSPEQAQGVSQLPPEIQKTVIPAIIQQAQLQKRIDGLTGDGAGKQFETQEQRDAFSSSIDRQRAAIEAQYERESREPVDEQTPAAEVDSLALPMQPAPAGPFNYEKALGTALAKTGDPMIARSVADAAQKEHLAAAKGDAELQKRITGSLAKARTKAEELDTRITSNRESRNNYGQIHKLMKTGKPMAGVTNKILSAFGLDKSMSNWQTQLVDKMLAAEPIRALGSLPAQAVRLSKVFSTLQDMHGKLINTPNGLMYIARLKMAEANAAEIVDTAHLNKLEEYRKAGLEPPFNLAQKVAKSVEKQVEPYMREAEAILSESMEDLHPELKGLPINKTFRDDDSGQVFKKVKFGSKTLWEVVEE